MMNDARLSVGGDLGHPEIAGLRRHTHAGMRKVDEAVLGVALI